ncbi:MAG: family 78 glycoside hydrolase catalytic domain [Planctomycetota bacterium]|nr:family 78 glycoside hydrolase catalytic domain [Planctomycetota bacterium]
MTFPTWFALAPILPLLAPRPLPAQDGPNPPREPRVELRSEPLDIDDANPRFSWEVDDSRRGAAQSAYQVLVATSVVTLRDGKGDMWDSQKVLAPDTVGVEYAGRPLAAGRTYSWSVRTWDAIGKPSGWSSPASFTAAPRGADAWHASWIRAGRAPDAASIGHKSEHSKTDDAWPWVQLDFGGDVRCNRVRLHPARPDGDLSKPGQLFPLRVRVYTDARGKFEDKAIRIAQNDFQDLPNAGAEPLDLDFSPYTLRYLRIVATKLQPDGEKGYAMALGEIEVLDGDQNIAPRGAITVSGSSGEAGWSPSALNDGALVPTAKSASAPESLPRLRGSVSIENPAARALLHVSALGAYELTVNGTPVGDARLAPGWTDYQKRVAYQTYDIASLLRQGDNVIGVQLAPAWYAGRLGLADQLGQGRKNAFYGADPAFFAQGEIVLESGKRVPFQTDANWRWNRSGPLVSADLFDGETRDARNESLGWDAPLFQGTDWRPVEIASDLKPTLFAARAEPIRAWDVRPALSVREVGPSTYLYDFGQNLSGVVRIRLAGGRGDTVVLRHGEVLDEKGRLYTANLRSAAQTDRFTLRGGVETLEPRFTVHGFRYVEVAGIPRALELDSIEALAVGNDLREVGSFTCSDDTLNRVWRAATWSLRSNFVGVPTDCPQRDERLGWMGDMQVVAPFALHSLDASNFLGSWLAEVRAAQTKDGRFPDFAPHPYDPEKNFRGAPGWGDAGVLVPWEIYLRTHDLKLLRSSAASALSWVKFVASKNPDFVWRNERGNDYGDWLNTSTLVKDGKPCEGCEVQKDLFATAFFARSARTAAKMAFAIGDSRMQSEAHAIAEQATNAFRATFVQGDRLVGDTQAAYALALDFGLCASADQAQDFADRLATRIREQGHLTCGIQTAHRALIALSEHGHHDLALDLARRKTLPSWGFMVENGGTTMWERWDGSVPGRGFQDAGMNSFNHYAFGAVGEWMVRELAGLQLVDDHADDGSIAIVAGPAGSTRSNAEGGLPWSRIRFTPRVTGGLTHARAEHRGVTGMIRSGWQLEGDVLVYACTVPPGSTARLELPAKDVASIAFDGKPLAEAKDMKPQWDAAGVARIELAAGSYEFRAKLR